MPAAALYAAVTPHGYGHGAITVAVLNALGTLRPDLRLALVGGPPEAWVGQRLRLPLALHDCRIDDPGMVNADSNTVLPADSLTAYRRLFDRFEAAVAEEMARQRSFRPDLVVSNVGFVPLEAARRLGIPAVALAPFHWGQILGAYCQAPDILERLQAIYAGAEAFLQTSPFVPMPDLGNTIPVGPICATAAPRRAELRAALGRAPDAPVVLVAMGGFGGELPVARWPRFPGWTLVTCGPDRAGPHPDVVRGDGLPFSFTELVASADVVLTKPGYGTVTEAACAGTAILYRERNDWPETPHMMTWAGAHVPVAEVAADEYQAGDFADKLQTLLQARERRPARPSGAAEAAAILNRYL
ncbi:hypothetical protein [Caenispirillum bisanense]|uniref:hypothetical protein n=1 Tax=Caenispirillum bisanense TaxID=414052 RepID=UPI0031D3537B